MFKVYLFLKRGLITFFSYRTAMVLGILTGLVSLLQFSFMGTFLSEGNSFPALAQYGGNLLAYLIIGTAFTAFLGVSLNSFQSMIRSEQQMGTLEFLLISNTRLEFLILYSGLINFVNAFVNVTILLLLVVFLFQVPMIVNVPVAFLTMLLTVTSLSGLGLMSAGIVMVTKIGDPVTWVITTLTGLLSGVLFPVEYLPHALRIVSLALPTTHALHVLRLSVIQGAGIGAVGPQLLLLLAISLVTVPLGFVVLRFGFEKARRAGSLAYY
jgi:ABC-2 type transport system permease protein